MQYEARVKYVDVRVITVEADSDDEAQAKFESGDFDEYTVDFYSDDILTPLRPVKKARS